MESAKSVMLVKGTYSEILGIMKWNSLCQSLSQVWFFVIPWTVTHQAPLSMELSRREY